MFPSSLPSPNGFQQVLFTYFRWYILLLFDYTHLSEKSFVTIKNNKVRYNMMQAKTPFCIHADGCIWASLKQAVKQVKYGVVIASILQLIKSLRSLTKGMAGVKKSFSAEYLTIIVFLSSSTLALRVVRCGLRWIRKKEDGLNALFAGMAAGYVGTLTLNKGYWYMLLMFVASRIIGAVYQALVQNRVLDPQNSSFHYYILFVISNMVNCYGYFIEADILKPDVYNLYEKMSALTPNEKRWHRSSLRYCLKTLRSSKVHFYNDFLQQKINKLTREISKRK